MEQQTKMSDAALKRAENKHAVLNVLSSEQRDQLSAIMEQRSAKVDGKGKRKGKRKGEGKHKGERGLKRALSTEQTAAIESIKSQAKEAASSYREKMKSFKQAERELIASGEFSADAWLSLSAEYKDDFYEMSMLRAKSKHDIWNILTPEQQSKMQRMMKRKHKGERKGKRQPIEA
ncbi:Spy/CpxP family protein refolding chaperone [Paraglaciecola aquimarina]|uniref:Spy/CpxP family protein refolding chaperone n=1 Tax=Paraglaciecola aquimarina TaxID=1235557 RepID=A0ABU3SVZ1_9ALTE|nr:Spy/CpxP family protein refolding chaperone [Paraglaciecola aquimarina]MDU0354087.1 Spy/CpxP family protein refolding chaperone [Paraglaciecola aquimarina]